eukprot:CAMPEP_0180116056 /NCGR_PEP_ID=MMETSP0986-20121125/149_1 /TAXON_ID=697907 /ORGANISM="non described non described, Strain CCMP2293" /LENGTH=45 /DNA_ID= /DNA_START= /DNA_END= /DNA_ORIENTATION=
MNKLFIMSQRKPQLSQLKASQGVEFFGLREHLWLKGPLLGARLTK